MPSKVYRVSSPLGGIPEMTLVVREIVPNDPRFASIELPSGAMHPRGITLRELRGIVGGDEGNLPDLAGRLHPISLKRWENADPDHTYLAVTFTYKGSDNPTEDPVVQALEANDDSNSGGS